MNQLQELFYLLPQIESFWRYTHIYSNNPECISCIRISIDWLGREVSELKRQQVNITSFSSAVAYLIGALEMQKFGFLFWLLFIWNSRYQKSKELIIKQIIVTKTHLSTLYLLVYKLMWEWELSCQPWKSNFQDCLCNQVFLCKLSNING